MTGVQTCALPICKTGTCQGLQQFRILPEVCKGCSKCARNCPVNAISGKVKEPFVIDQAVCIKCGACLENCPFGAVVKDSGNCPTA